MHPLSASNLLDIWERGVGRSPIEQALAILGIAFPQASGDMLAKLNVFQRDLCLLHLHGLTFGSQIKGLADCPACNQRLELGFNGDDLPASNTPFPDPEIMRSLNSETSFRMDDYEVTFRLPNSMDLIVVSRLTDTASRRQKLIDSCIISAQHDGKTLVAGELPSEVLNTIVERMSQETALADLMLPTTCPACGHTWEIIFDIASFFWSEINAWSIRLMRDVHSLATAYGWREEDILAMSAWRRQRYLEMVSV